MKNPAARRVRAEAQLAQGQTVDEVCRQLGISDATYYNWRRQYGQMKLSQIKQFKAVQKETTQAEAGKTAFDLAPALVLEDYVPQRKLRLVFHRLAAIGLWLRVLRHGISPPMFQLVSCSYGSHTHIIDTKPFVYLIFQRAIIIDVSFRCRRTRTRNRNRPR